ncbi:hypothetical protein Emed_006552 [Eimeria media]
MEPLSALSSSSLLCLVSYTPKRRLGAEGFLKKASRAAQLQESIGKTAAAAAPAATAATATAAAATAAAATAAAATTAAATAAAGAAATAAAPSVLLRCYSTAAHNPRSRAGAAAASGGVLKGLNNESSSAYLESSKDDLIISSNTEEEGQLQQEVEKSFSIFDRIYRHAVSPESKNTGGSAGAAAAAAAAASAKALRSSLAAAKELANDTPAASAQLLLHREHKAEETPSVLLTILRDLKNAHVRTSEAWGPPLLLLLRQLPLLSATELQQTAALLAAASCRPPLLLQGLCEALTWRSKAKQAEASTVILFMDSLRRLRYRPSASHMNAFFSSIDSRRKPLSASELLKILRFADELEVMQSFPASPLLLALVPQLKKNASALKPPEAAAFAALLLRRKELDQETAESLSSAVYGHLEGPTSVLLLQQQASHTGDAPQQPQQQQQQQQQQLQHMLQRQRERAASSTSLSWVLHLGRSLAAANLERIPPPFCMALEREVELHWAALTPNEVSETLSVLARLAHRPTSALNKLGLAIKQGLQYYKPRVLAGCLSCFDRLAYRHHALLEALSEFILHKQIAPLHQQHQRSMSPEQNHLAEPFPSYKSMLPAVCATMPTTPVEAAPLGSSLLDLEHHLQQREEQRAAAATAAARAGKLSSHHVILTPKPLPPDSHLPPPLVVDVHKESSSARLLEQQHTLPEGEAAQPSPSEVFMAVTCDPAAAPASPAAPEATSVDQPAAALSSLAPTLASSIATAANAEPTTYDCVDPFLAAVLLQHLSHLQHKKNPELLSALLASVSAAAAKHLPKHEHQAQQHVQQPGHSLLLTKGGNWLAPAPSPMKAEGSPAASDLRSGCTVSIAAPSVPAAVTGAASRAAPTHTSVAFSRGNAAVGTHQLRECNTAFAAAAAAVAAECWKQPAPKSRASAPSESLPSSGHQPSKSESEYRSEAADKLENSKKIHMRQLAGGAQLIPTGQGAVKRLRESGASASLDFSVLSWPAFVSKYGQFSASGSSLQGNTRNGSSGNSSSSNSSSRKRPNTVKGFVPAGAQVIRLKTKHEREQQQRLLLLLLSLLLPACVYSANILRLWGSQGPPNLRRLRRRHLRKLTLHTRAKATAAAAIIAASSKAAAAAATATCTFSGDENQLFRDTRWRLARAAAASAARAAARGTRAENEAALSNTAADASAITLIHRRRNPTYGQQQVMPCPPSRQAQHFPLGLSFSVADCSFPLMVDTGPLVSLSMPDNVASSVRKRVQQEHRRRVREAADAQEWLQKLHQQRIRVRVVADEATPAKDVGTHLDSAALETSANVAADAAPVTLGTTPSLSSPPPTLQLTAAAGVKARESLPGTFASRRQLRDNRRLLEAIAVSLAAAADMKILTLRIAAPLVQRFAKLSACSPKAAVGAAHLAACCTAARAALQTLGLRPPGFPRAPHLPRRRAPRGAPPELESLREELLISLEASFRRSWPFLRRQEAAHKGRELTHHETPATGSERRKRGSELQQLIPEAAYLYAVVLQALIHTAHEDRSPSGLAACWLQKQEQEQHVLAFCSHLGTTMSSLTSSGASSLNSLTSMLCASRCLHDAVRMGWAVERNQQLLSQLRHIQQALAVSLQESIARGGKAILTGGTPREFFAALVALAMSSELANGEGASRAAAAADSARNNKSFPSVVLQLANQLQLPLRKLEKWASDASADEKLLLQPRGLKQVPSTKRNEPASLPGEPGLMFVE